MFVRYAFFLSLAVLFPFCIIYIHEIIPKLCIFITVIWRIDLALVALTLTHDSSHFSFTHKPWVWRAFGSVHDLFLGVSFFFGCINISLDITLILISMGRTLILIHNVIIHMPCVLNAASPGSPLTYISTYMDPLSTVFLA